MLNVAKLAGPDRSHPSRVGALRASVRPCARTAGLGRVAATVGFGAVPLVVRVVREGALGPPLIVLGLVSGAAVGWIVDDPTAELLTPCPIPESVRLLIQSVLAFTMAVACACIAIAVGAITSGLPHGWRDRAVEFCVAAACALGAGLIVRRRGEPFGGVTAVSVGLLLPITIAAMAFRWPTTFPIFDSASTHVRWWLVVVAAFATACFAGRDRARPALTLRRITSLARRAPV